MIPLILAPWALVGCESGGIVIDDPKGGTDSADADTDTDSDTDSDTDTDADTDTDTDTDADTDTDTEPPPDILVDCEGSADYTEIQPAIEAATSGDRIGVMPCEYDERLDFLGKSIDVYGIEGSAVTTLDADSGGTAVNIENGEGDGTRFAGFTIVEGADDAGGSALEIGFSSAALEDLVITENVGYDVIQILGGWVDMKDVRIYGNHVTKEVINVDAGGLTAEGIELECDGAEQGIWHHVALNLDRSTIVCDSGYGIYNYHGTSIIQRSYIYGATDGLYSADEENTPEEPDDPSEENRIYNSAIGGGEVGANMLYQYVIVENSVFWGGQSGLSLTACNTASYVMNSAFVRSACGITSDQPIQHGFSAFYENDSDGCGLTVSPAVTADPLFTSFPDDLTLQPSSPLRNAGNPDPAYDDPDGTRNDIGRYGGLFGE